MRQRAGIAYPLPLRNDFMAQLVLPPDLTSDEAERIMAMVRTLVIPRRGDAEAGTP